MKTLELTNEEYRVLSRLLEQQYFIRKWLGRYGRVSKHEASTMMRIMGKLKLPPVDLRP